MVFNIATFRAEGLPQDGARPALFEVYFPASPAIPSNVNVSDTIVRAQAASIPEMRLTNIDVYYQGRPVPYVGERVFTPWTVRFYNEIDFALRDYFEAWSNMCNTLIGNQTLNTNFVAASAGGYAVDGVIVRQFARQLNNARSYVFYGMWPEVVGAIELNWEAANRIETFDVQFRYAYFVPAGSFNSPTSPDDGIVSAPGSLDVLGVPAQEGAGSIPITQVGALLTNPSVTAQGTQVNVPSGSVSVLAVSTAPGTGR